MSADIKKVERVLRDYLTGDGFIAECDIENICSAIWMLIEPDEIIVVDVDERGAFEAWAKRTNRRGNFDLRDGDRYADGYANSDWYVWQARAALGNQNKEPQS